MSYRKLSQKDEMAIEKLVWQLLLSVKRIHFGKAVALPINDPSYAEAFGVMQGLAALRYGYLGPSNGNNDPLNLRAWFKRIADEVGASALRRSGEPESTVSRERRSPL